MMVFVPLLTYDVLLLCSNKNIDSHIVVGIIIINISMAKEIFYE